MPGSAFRTTSTTSRPKASTATGRAYAEADADAAKHCRERFARQGRPVRASEPCGLVDRAAGWNQFRLRAVARAWRAGAGAGDLGRWAKRDLRQLRFDRDSLVAEAQCGRAGASFPCA